jgi:hypothetical protein
LFNQILDAAFQRFLFFDQRRQFFDVFMRGLRFFEIFRETLFVRQYIDLRRFDLALFDVQLFALDPFPFEFLEFAERRRVFLIIGLDRLDFLGRGARLGKVVFLVREQKFGFRFLALQLLESRF